MKLTRFFQLLVIASLLLSFGGSPVQQEFTAKAQPQLAQMAAEQPEALVRVIVQQFGGASGAEDRVAALGGEVVADLHIINAFAAEMTAKAAVDLARSETVRWVSLDAPTENAGKPQPPTTTTNPSNYYLDTLRVRDLWAMGLQGQGIGIAIVDSGVWRGKDFQVDPASAKPDSRVVVQTIFNYNGTSSGDVYGHGTHVAGIAAGSGYKSSGAYTGIAPGANLFSLRVSDDTGKSYESDVVAALQWVYDNKSTYNIRVVNLSLNSTVPVSYHQSPLDAAVEILWFNGVVVVASAGNYSSGPGNPILSAPANDPFIITVGAVDEKGTSNRSDDVWANFSSIGNTQDGFYKPEIHAPGKNIVSVLSSSGQWGSLYPDRVVMNGDYFRLSGTSMAAPMVTGVVALLLQDEPNLTPDQVKYRIVNNSPWQGAVKYLDAYAVVTGTTTQSANTGIMPSQMLATGPDAVNFASVGWNSVGWNSVGWNSVGWNSVGWNSVGWNSVGWNSTFWGQ